MSDITRFAISYHLAQTFNRRIQLSTYWARLRPAPHTRASVAAFTLKIDADPHFVNWARDPFENYLARLDFPERLQSIALTMELVVDLKPVNPFDFLVEDEATNYPFDYPVQLKKELTPYLRLGSVGKHLEAWFKALKPKSGSVIDTLNHLNMAVYKKIKCTGETRPGPVNLETLLQNGQGTPWELAWLLTLSFRYCGLGARFVSGLRLDQGDSSTIPDRGSFHAWSEVFLPGAGWVGLDPSGGLFTAESHIPLATAPEPLRATPLVGYFEACDVKDESYVTVKRLKATPPEWPLTSTQWHDINVVAEHVDKTLNKEKIKATGASSIAFVAAAYAEEPEWSTHATGPSKKRYAEDLLVRLQQRIAPAGVVQMVQGEWFAGEPLPRWRLHCLFRRDGKPCWKNPDLLGNDTQSKNASSDDALRFITALTESMAINTRFILPAHEDQLHGLWMNRIHPGSIPDRETLRDPMQRIKLADKLSTSNAAPTAHVLPLRWDPVVKNWASGVWTFRRKALYLIPGDSPPGFRLPLGSLPRNRDAVIPEEPERCQFEPREVLPSLHGELSARFSSIPSVEEQNPIPLEADGEINSAAPRTALCLDVRNGCIHIFLPPLTHIEHYLELITLIENIAIRLQTPVILEGYEPPYDARLRRFVIEPDAGVLKVALPEATNWEEAKNYINAAYEEAAAIGLAGERQTDDGRSLPPGGGGEITIGGDDPASSPFLQRPEVLRSFITYWQKHPSLSYFFAGRMIGAGGSAPRVDEGRNEALYELDMALQRIPAGWSQKPWEPDRILRHLLTDTAGDMRNAEIRVDKLYPPERSATRLGQITVRSFETAPTQRLAALQWLLVRSIVAASAINPKRASLTNWGSALRDRFMLPECLWQDLLEVLAELNEAGFPLQAEWFEPYLDLRFPSLGTIQLGDLSLELRTAHESWPMLAEEVSAGGISRFIDSANDRIQIMLSGATPERYIVLCNDRQVPLNEIAQRGKYIAGVRYKFSNPHATLHPTLPPEGALVFDVVDSWTGRVIGGCTYLPPQPSTIGHVGLPPFNPLELEPGQHAVQKLLPAIAMPPLQRGGRFLPHGSGRDRIIFTEEPAHSRFPNLLDLTRVIA